MRILQGLVVAAALAMPLGAHAQSAGDSDFTVDDIVNHFKPETPEEPKTRGVSFGASGFGETGKNSEGGTTVGSPTGTTVSKPAEFNLLITFDWNSDSLTDRAQSNLRKFAAAMDNPKLKTLKFAIDGHTDAVGSDVYNQDLSERRARAVVSFLTSLGVETDRLIPRGFGETQPKNADGRAPENRRVEARLAE